MIKHLACIMDGNRRWAKQRDMMPWYGHQEGAQAVNTAISFCLEKGISYLSLYTFSLENLNRPEQEKNFIFSYLVDQADAQLASFIKQGITVRFVGERSLFPPEVAHTCQKIEGATAGGTKLTILVLFCYGSRQELLAATRSLAALAAAGTIEPAQITDELLREHLWTGLIPDPDLIIRTGAVHRLSNFLLYQSAYSELYFLDCLWPEISTADLQKALDYFLQTKRNFGV